MSNYPTREAIDTTRKTLLSLYNEIDQGTVVASVAARTLSDAARICDALDDVPGLHYPAEEPEPKPKPTAAAAEVLGNAYYQAHVRDLGVVALVLDVARNYALARPQWFAGLDWCQPACALALASQRAYDADNVAPFALRAAEGVASAHPYLFGGAK